MTFSSSIYKQIPTKSTEMEEKIKVYPKTKPLSAPELISMRNIEIGSLKVGLKKTKPSGLPEETEELAKIYAELRKQLSAPRIERIAGRSEGVWDSDRNAVKVLRKEGKFDVFGYHLNGDHYLEYYEALFLLELNRLEIFYNSVRMSIEQAYILLLGEDESIKYNTYLVYSMFARVGYIVQKYQNTAFVAREPTAEDCIWEVLLNSVQKKPIPEYVRSSEHFLEVEQSMKAICERIMTQDAQVQEKDEGGEENIESISFAHKCRPSGKRKASSAGPSSVKRERHDVESSAAQESFIDFLTKEEEYKRLEGLFKSFDIIKMQPQFDYGESASRDLDIHFDVYLHSDCFKKSEPKPPTFRVAILGNDQDYPNRAQISRCFHSQEYQVPILLVTVSASKQIQAFLYHFT